jgi:hypothetical protein
LLIQVKSARNQPSYKLAAGPKRRRAVTKPIPDKAEVAVEYPDKLYIGTFERTDVSTPTLTRREFSLGLHRTGADDVRKSVHMHFHYALFAEILHELAKTVASLPADDLAHREALCDAARAFHLALEGDKRKSDDPSDLTPEEEVRLLHILE